MKNKGINLVEQHIEKIVLGVAGAVFFSALAWQLVGNVNHVTVAGDSIAPSELDSKIATATKAIRDRPKVDLSAIKSSFASQAGTFQQRLASGVGPDGQLPRIEAGLASVLQSDGTSGGKPFHDARLAAVAMQETLQLSDTFDATTVREVPQLKAFYGDSVGPFDIVWAIPCAIVDLKSIRAELDSTARGLQIPKLWYRDSLLFIDVAFERERLKSDGTWSEPTLVDAVPGAFSFRPEIAKGADAGLRDAAFKYLEEKSAQLKIVQPDFLPTRRDVFSPGLLLAQSTGSSASTETAEVRGLRKEVAKRSVEVKRLKDELEEAGGELDDKSKEDKKKEDEKKKNDEKKNSGNGSDGSSGASRPGGGIGGAMDGGKRGSGAEDVANKEKRIRMTKGLRALEKRLEGLEAKLGGLLGVDEAAKAAAASASAASVDVMAADNLMVWTHDIGVSPGETYRYRASVKTYNPFFSNGSLLVKEQAALDDSFTLDSATSPWGPPIRVAPPVEFFVIDAIASEGRLGVGQATIEVFRYHDGERHRERFSVQPGDAIGAGGDRSGISYDTGCYLVDVFADVATDRGGADRRASAIAVVQSRDGERYVIRVPKSDVTDPRRAEYEDEIEIAKANRALLGGDASDAAKEGESTPAAPGGGLGGGRGLGGR